MRDLRATTATATTSENVRVSAAPVAELREHCPEWDRLSDSEKAATLARAASRGIDGSEQTKTSNTTCVELDETRVDALDPSKSATALIDLLAVGTGTTTPAYSDRSLESEVARTDTTDHDDRGTSILTRTFLDTNEANGASSDLTEVGLVLSTGALANRSLITGITKTSSKAVTFEVELVFDTAP